MIEFEVIALKSHYLNYPAYQGAICMKTYNSFLLRILILVTFCSLWCTTMVLAQGGEGHDPPGFDRDRAAIEKDRADKPAGGSSDKSSADHEKSSDRMKETLREGGFDGGKGLGRGERSSLAGDSFHEIERVRDNIKDVLDKLDRASRSDHESKPDLNYHPPTSIQLPRNIVRPRWGIIQEIRKHFFIHDGWAFFPGSWHHVQGGGFYKDGTIGVGIGGTFGRGTHREPDYHGKQ